MTDIPLPLDGLVTAYFNDHAPEAVRAAIRAGDKRDILADDFPYQKWMKKDAYEAALKPLQRELVKMQHWLGESGARVVVIFEGRDGAGKSGAINRISEVTNPRHIRIEALPRPTERNLREWYFQRYVERLPAGGEMVLFDRSWYNRAIIEHVFGFCKAPERERFFAQLPDFEKLLVQDGVVLVKIWLNVSRAEQLRRLLERERDPMRHWKLSKIDIDGLAKWDSYTRAIAETFARSHTDHAPWTIIRAEDKYRARLAVLQTLLNALPYAWRDPQAIGQVDAALVGGPATWGAEYWQDGS
jgi:polyphosphate kinase 2